MEARELGAREIENESDNDNKGGGRGLDMVTMMWAVQVASEKLEIDLIVEYDDIEELERSRNRVKTSSERSQKTLRTWSGMLISTTRGQTHL